MAATTPEARERGLVAAGGTEKADRADGGTDDVDGADGGTEKQIAPTAERRRKTNEAPTLTEKEGLGTPSACLVIPPEGGVVEGASVTKVTVRDGETVDRAIKRFKRKVEQAGILKEVRKREHYLKPSVKAKLKARAAEARARKREKRLLQNAGV